MAGCVLEDVNCDTHKSGTVSHERPIPGVTLAVRSDRNVLGNGGKKGMVNGNGTRSEYRNRTSREGKHCIDIKHYANGSGGARQAEWKGMETVIVITKSNSTRGRVEAWQRLVAGACEKKRPRTSGHVHVHARIKNGCMASVSGRPSETNRESRNAKAQRDARA